jgi:hypothetical protein
VNHHGQAQYDDGDVHDMHGPCRVGAPWACHVGLEATAVLIAHDSLSPYLVGPPPGWTGADEDWERDSDGEGDGYWEGCDNNGEPPRPRLAWPIPGGSPLGLPC